MADSIMFYLVQWEDRLISVIKKNQILEPLKDSYDEGDLIFATFNRKRYEAVICEIHPNMKYLNQEAKLPVKYSYTEVRKQKKALKATQGSGCPKETVLIKDQETPTFAASSRREEENIYVQGSAKSQEYTEVIEKQPLAFTSQEKPFQNQDLKNKEDKSVCQDKLKKSKVSSLEDECKSLRGKIRKIEERVSALETKTQAPTCDSQTDEDRAVVLVSHLSPSDVGTTVQILARHFFSEDNELKTSSRTGKRNNKVWRFSETSTKSTENANIRKTCYYKNRHWKRNVCEEI